jgi:hypothetical protein
MGARSSSPESKPRLAQMQFLRHRVGGCIERCSPLIAADRWHRALLAAALSVAVALLGGAPASAMASTPSYGYDTAVHVYDAPVELSSPNPAPSYVRGSPTARKVGSRVSPASVRDRGVAANSVSDVARPLSQVESRTLADASRTEKLSHVFDPKHNLGPLVETYGSKAGAMEQIVRSLDGAALPSSGLFVVTTRVGGQGVVVRGAVVDGVPRVGTVFTP